MLAATHEIEKLRQDVNTNVLNLNNLHSNNIKSKQTVTT